MLKSDKNPSFSTSHIREMTEIFVTKSQEVSPLTSRHTGCANSEHTLDQLKGTLMDQIKSPNTGTRVDILKYLSSTTLDIIGLAGFNYEFNALKNEHNELSLAFDGIIGAEKGIPIFVILKELFPFLRPILRFDKTSKNLAYAEKTIQSVGLELIKQKQKEIEAEIHLGKKGASKDLLALLIRSNLIEKGDKLTDVEVLHQIPTFLIAGEINIKRK
jgi:cytochrome P450